MPAAQKITPELLRRRAEHNDGDLSTLEEITLHQFDIEKIENIDIYCKRLKILYLQNNQITKIENIRKLKELEYLNLALNNIIVIENLEGCESLRKLDLTVNFIDDLACIKNLIPCRELRELYLTGNPITSKPGYREYVVCTLPQLHILDGTPVTPSERIQARQKYEEIVHEQSRLPVGETPEIPDAQELDLIDQLPSDEVARQFQQTSSEHTIKARMTTARQLAKLRSDKEPGNRVGEVKKKANVSSLNRIAQDGRIMQCNEGKYPFDIQETRHVWILKVPLSKYLDTAKIQVDMFEDHVKIRIVDKLLQLRMETPISKDRSMVQRSQTTGELVVYMVKLKCNILGNALDILAFEKKDKECKKKKEELERTQNDVTKGINAVEPSSLLKHEKEMKSKTSTFSSGSTFLDNEADCSDFEDDPSVPPLV